MASVLICFIFTEMNNSEEDNVKKPLDEVELDDQPLSAPTSPSAPPLQPDGLYPNLEDVVGSPSACSPRKSPGCVSTYSGVSEHMKMKVIYPLLVNQSHIVLYLDPLAS